MTTEPPGAYITTRDSMQIIIEFDPLAFYVAKDESAHFFNDYIALAVRKNSPYKNVLDEL